MAWYLVMQNQSEPEAAEQQSKEQRENGGKMPQNDDRVTLLNGK